VSGGAGQGGGGKGVVSETAKIIILPQKMSPATGGTTLLQFLERQRLGAEDVPLYLASFQPPDTVLQQGEFLVGRTVGEKGKFSPGTLVHKLQIGRAGESEGSLNLGVVKQKRKKNVALCLCGWGKSTFNVTGSRGKKGQKRKSRLFCWGTERGTEWSKVRLIVA